MKVHINSHWSGDRLSLIDSRFTAKAVCNKSAGFIIETVSELLCNSANSYRSVLVDDDIQHDGALDMPSARIVGIAGFCCGQGTRRGSCSAAANTDYWIAWPSGPDS